MNAGSLTPLIKRFDALSMRERCLVAAGLLIILVIAWYSAVMQPLLAKERSIATEVESLQQEVSTATETIQNNGDSDELRLASEKQRALEATLAQVNAKLESAQSGLIPPQKMKEVIHDVLSRQRGLKLVSLRNQPVHSLVEAPAPAKTAAAAQSDESSSTDAAAVSPPSGGPFVHPVQLVVEGSYLDVLAYLRALEALPWHFYWKTLDIETLQYPNNRVTIELSTLSMDKQWLGV